MILGDDIDDMGQPFQAERYCEALLIAAANPLVAPLWGSGLLPAISNHAGVFAERSPARRPKAVSCHVRVAVPCAVAAL